MPRILSAEVYVASSVPPRACLEAWGPNNDGEHGGSPRNGGFCIKKGCRIVAEKVPDVGCEASIPNDRGDVRDSLPQSLDWAGEVGVDLDKTGPYEGAGCAVCCKEPVEGKSVRADAAA